MGIIVDEMKATLASVKTSADAAEFVAQNADETTGVAVTKESCSAFDTTAYGGLGGGAAITPTGMTIKRGASVIQKSLDDLASGGGEVTTAQLEDVRNMLYSLALSQEVGFLGSLEDSVVDSLSDLTGIETDNSEGLWDAVLKRWSTVQPATNQTATADFTSSADFSQRDLRGTITYYYRTGTNTGIFQTAEGGSDVTVGASGTNTDVVAGVLCTIGGSTYTIQSISTGDNKTVTLDGDPSSNSCTSIHALTVSNGNVIINTVLGDATTVGTSSAQANNLGIATTHISYGSSHKLTNGRYITSFEMYDGASHTGNLVAKLCQETSSGVFTITDLQVYAGITTSIGVNTYTLTTPFKVPDSGDYYFGYWASFTIMQGNGPISPAGLRAQPGNWVGSGISGWSLENAQIAFKIYQKSYVGSSALCVALTNSNTNFNSMYWADINSAAVSGSHPGSSILCGAYVKNFNEATEKWYICKSGTTFSIVELVSGTWKYRDAAGDLQTATVQDRLHALEQAMAISQNQMSPSEVAAISDAHWNDVLIMGSFVDGVWTPGDTSVPWALGLKASGSDIPSVDKITMNFDYGATPIDLVLTSNVYQARQNDPTDAQIVAQIHYNVAYTPATDLKVEISIDGGTHWETVGYDSKVSAYGSADNLLFKVSGITARTSKNIVIRTSTLTGKDVSVGGYGCHLEWVA